MPEPMSRAEHLQWAKDRALAYVDAGDLASAGASFLSDLSKHPAIKPGTVHLLYALEALSGGLNTPDKVRAFINGTN
ncbi:hypothetical protein J0X19_22025 [Hymenobacter sp. BT186]|uniref:Uncharacterized protein n=1 Tax=Hymenobacter telluris TaxID=2816474 RepID=A0A939JB83_9BACT|nr:hypothetical protein [Hymenobacter telluris]MBO0360654.1 hypothetical protein [Hymenobacter telluris]MBW3376681.1 hypothetical protein [Hymenobacter norwichensis]